MKIFYGILTLAILCLSVVSLFSITVNAQQTDSWPMFHGNLAHTGYLTGTGPSANQTLWVFKTGGRVWSSPAVVNGVVYFGSFDRNVYAVNAKDGTEIWNFSTGGGIYSSPAVADNIVYVGSNDHNIYALNAQPGALIWNYTTSGIESNLCQAQCPPTVSGGIVYAGSNDHNLYALNATNGVQIWNFTTGGDVISSPAIPTE